MTASNLLLIGGGARSGKSAYAVRRALRFQGERVFVATAEPFDAEMQLRIAAHAVERGDAFRTVEAPRELESALEALVMQHPGVAVALIDCLTLWLSNLLLADVATTEIERRVERLGCLAASAPFPVLLVSNEVGMGLVPETPLGRLFRDVTGRAHQQLARTAGEVYLATLGCVLRIKPNPVMLAEEYES